ncbi:baseplate hub assembly protein [Pantoea phage Phynn]|nr:baseplate hub assembly protein [Pantoea phage Phynn]
MVNVVRVKLLKGIKRFPLFTVKDHMSFIMTSADMEGKTPSDQQQILDEVLDILFPGLSRTEQECAFVKCYCASFGKNAIKVGIRSAKGVSETFMIIHDYDLQNEYAVDENVTLGFTFPAGRGESEKVFLECISYVIHNGTKYTWESLEEETKNNILDLVTMEDMEQIVLMLTKSCHVTVRDSTLHTLSPLFKVLFNKAEMMEFFKTNYLLNKNSLNIDNMMNCSPMERSIYIALLSEDLKNRKESA